MPLSFRPSLPVRALAGVVLVAALAAPGIAQTSDPAYRPMTAKELLAGIDEGSLAAGPADDPGTRKISTDRATAYIVGVADSAVGRRWCRPQGMPFSDLAVAVYGYLSALPEKSLGAPAASVVTRALAAKYPCKRSSHSSP